MKVFKVGFFKKHSGKDTLERKKNSVSGYISMFETAVSAVTSMSTVLKNMNDRINTDIDDIDEYQKNLEETKTQLNEMREKNKRVIDNISALLGE